jgi:hypothetical protein
MAGTTGFEPATSDVTGRRSNQLNYVPAYARSATFRITQRAAGRHRLSHFSANGGERFLVC